MTETPYQTPLDTDKNPELSDPDRTQQGNLDHRFWVALLVCPMTGPTLIILLITSLGFIYQASGSEGSEAANPKSLIFFPIFDFLILATVNYLGMGMTFFPRIISIKKEHGVITFACALRIWLRSIVDLLLFATFIGLMIGVAYNSHASFGILSGLAASIIFIPTTLLSAIGFWIYGERVRVLSKSKP